MITEDIRTDASLDQSGDITAVQRCQPRLTWYLAKQIVKSRQSGNARMLSLDLSQHLWYTLQRVAHVCTLPSPDPPLSESVVMTQP